MGITRRQVLAATAALGAASVVGVGAVGIAWWDRPPGEGLRALSASEYALVQALAEAWMPAGGEPALSGADANVGAFFDEVVSQMAPLQGKLLKTLLHALDARTLPTHGAFYTGLDLPTRTAVLGGWLDAETYLARQAIGAVMALISFGWTLHPEVTAVFAPSFRCGYGR